MAYRRKQSMPRSSTFEDHSSPTEAPAPAADDDQPPSLAAQAIRASSAHRDSSLSSAYGESAFSSSAYLESKRRRPSRSPQDSTGYEYTSMKSLDDSKHGFWGVLARKAKSILEDDNVARKFDEHGRHPPQMVDTTTGGQFNEPHWSPENNRRTDNPTIHKGSEAIASSLNYIGGTIKNALEEGLTIVENRTADIIQETRKLQIRRKSGGSGGQSQATDLSGAPNLSQSHNDQETQLKASRDVANAMAAKAKLLLRELKTVKADLAFAKERCTQLEEENKNLRENRQKGAHPEDDDLIRLQLETLLAEKGRLAHENSVYARENRFLREIVEYHQLTMQDVVYLDEGAEEVTEVATPLIQFSVQSPSHHHHHRHPSSEPPSPHLTSTPSTPTTAKSSPPPSPLPPVDPNSTPSQSPTVSAEGVMRHQERPSTPR